MIQAIDRALPGIDRDTENFNKSHSQFMTAAVDITALTPTRSIKHVLAEISRTRSALNEAEIKRRRSEIDRLEVMRELESHPEGSLAYMRATVDLDECNVTETALKDAMQGAIRKLAFLVKQHQSLLEHMGKDRITEADYERGESRYHTLTCLKQALCAARSRGGVIDEGNQIYLFDMGLPAALVQKHILDYLKSESEMIEAGKAPTHSGTVEWMNAVADEIEKFSLENIARRGLCAMDKSSLIGSES